MKLKMTRCCGHKKHAIGWDNRPCCKDSDHVCAPVENLLWSTQCVLNFEEKKRGGGGVSFTFLFFPPKLLENRGERHRGVLAGFAVIRGVCAAPETCGLNHLTIWAQCASLKLGRHENRTQKEDDDLAPAEDRLLTGGGRTCLDELQKLKK